MKIFKNIIPAIKIYGCLKYLTAYKTQIETARTLGDIETEKDGILKATDSWGNHILDAFDIKLVVNGSENIPTEGPVVYVANHQGYADIPACCAALNKIQFGFVAKDVLEKVPLYGNWIKRIRSVLIKRNDARSSLRTINEAIDLIEQGYSMLVFPEGTRSRCHEMAEFKKGSLRLATKPGVPVVPITIDGTYKCFEEKGYFEGGHTFTITVHPAIPTAGMSKPEANNLAEKVQEIVQSAL